MKWCLTLRCFTPLVHPYLHVYREAVQHKSNNPTLINYCYLWVLSPSRAACTEPNINSNWNNLISTKIALFLGSNLHQCYVQNVVLNEIYSCWKSKYKVTAKMHWIRPDAHILLLSYEGGGASCDLALSAEPNRIVAEYILIPIIIEDRSA